VLKRAELLFVPLGGVGEIGMNLSLYGVGSPDAMRWLMVDCGITFPEGASLPGIETIMPNVRFIAEDRQTLEGIVLTHGHEDHIGALLDLWPALGCNVYATPFTAGLLAAKIASEPWAPKIPIKTVPKGGRWSLGPFEIELLPVSHSIPESYALAIRTAVGNILHTGDWKIDPSPPLGEVTDMARFAAFGSEGVDALIGDSTNAVRSGRSPSETEVARVLRELVGSARGRVAVTLFASNIGRIQSIAEAAVAANREVVLLGRALERNIAVARETGYLAHLPDFLDMEAYGYLPREKVCAIMTGSQGEERSALARVARGDHPHVTLNKGDRVIFSSRVIPGNERAVSEMLNGLVSQGVELITDRTHLVHVSGHPRTDEMRELVTAVKPRAVIPVHGEPVHLEEHASLARIWGVAQNVVARNGAVVRLAPGPVEIVDWVPAGRLLKDGKVLLDEQETDAVPERRRLQRAGVVSVALAVTAKGEIVGEIDVHMAGVPEQGVTGRSIRDTILDAAEGVVEGLPKSRRKDRALVEEAIVRAVRAAVEEEWGKKPTCHVSVLVV
jgi:ribonuclease J